MPCNVSCWRTSKTRVISQNECIIMNPLKQKKKKRKTHHQKNTAYQVAVRRGVAESPRPCSLGADHSLLQTHIILPDANSAQHPAISRPYVFSRLYQILESHLFHFYILAQRCRGGSPGRVAIHCEMFGAEYSSFPFACYSLSE